MGQSWGPDARVYVSADGFAAAGFLMVARTQDLVNTDEAEDLKAKAREFGVTIHHQGSKEFAIEFQRLLKEEDDEDDDILALKEAYDDGTPLFVLITRKPLDEESGDGLRFVGTVIKFPESFPQDGPTLVTISIKPSDDEQPVERVETPYVLTE